MKRYAELLQNEVIEAKDKKPLHNKHGAIIIFAMIFGWGNGGWGNGFGGNGANSFLPYAVGMNGALTRGDLCSEFSFNDLQNAVRGVQQGICDSTFALNNTVVNGFNGVSSAICNLGYEQAQLSNATNTAMLQGFHGVDNAICNSQFATQQGFNNLASQLSGCCCDIRAGMKDIQYQNATDTCAIQTSLANVGRDIIDNANANYRGLMDFMVQSKIDSLQNENQALRLSASQAQQNATIGAMINASEANIIRRTGNDCPIPAYVVPNPNCCYGPFGGYNFSNNNCGCNSGCGC